MRGEFWSLLGPSLFVDRIEYAVRDGLNVVVRFRTIPRLDWSVSYEIACAQTWNGRPLMRHTLPLKLIL